jgi:hypothetical protein
VQVLWEGGEIGLMRKGLSAVFLAQIIHTVYEFLSSNYVLESSETIHALLCTKEDGGTCLC